MRSLMSNEVQKTSKTVLKLTLQSECGATFMHTRYYTYVYFTVLFNYNNCCLLTKTLFLCLFMANYERRGHYSLKERNKWLDEKNMFKILYI
jgi:hypothetical protein